MKIEQQVCSLELSKKLKELGVKQESYFAWVNIETHDPYIMPSYTEHYKFDDYMISAFTASELFNILPSGIIVEKTTDGYEIGRRILNLNDIDKFRIDVLNENLANALSEYLIYLIENKILTFGLMDLILNV